MMNGDGSGYGGPNGNGNFVTPPDSPGYYYNAQQNPMMGVQQPQAQQHMGEQPQALLQPQQQQQQPPSQPQQQMGYSSPSPTSMFPFTPPSNRLSAGGISSPALAKALATLSADKNRRPRSEKKPIPDEQKDDKYFERRRRNNEAAKKSRDSRKQREDELAVRASLLEKSNSVLKVQVMSMREEAMKLRQMWFQKCHTNGMRNAVNGMDNHNNHNGMAMQQTNGMQQNPLSSHQGRSS